MSPFNFLKYSSTQKDIKSFHALDLSFGQKYKITTNRNIHTLTVDEMIFEKLGRETKDAAIIFGMAYWINVT